MSPTPRFAGARRSGTLRRCSGHGSLQCHDGCISFLFSTGRRFLELLFTAKCCAKELSRSHTSPVIGIFARARKVFPGAAPFLCAFPRKVFWDTLDWAHGCGKAAAFSGNERRVAPRSWNPSGSSAVRAERTRARPCQPRGRSNERTCELRWWCLLTGARPPEPRPEPRPERRARTHCSGRHEHCCAAYTDCRHPLPFVKRV